MIEEARFYHIIHRVLNSNISFLFAVANPSYLVSVDILGHEFSHAHLSSCQYVERYIHKRGKESGKIRATRTATV